VNVVHVKEMKQFLDITSVFKKIKDIYKYMYVYVTRFRVK